jgi:hypothetical protein
MRVLFFTFWALVFGKIDFQPPGKFAPCEHDAMLAKPAFKTNIRAETDDSPFIGAAWMRLTQTQVIVKLQVG